MHITSQGTQACRIGWERRHGGGVSAVAWVRERGVVATNCGSVPSSPANTLLVDLRPKSQH